MTPNRPLTAALLALASAAAASAATTIEFEVLVVRRIVPEGGGRATMVPTWRQLPLDATGRARLLRTLRLRMPADEIRRSHSWRIFHRLRDRQVREAMIAAASVGGETTIKVRVNPFDRRRSLLAGEVIEVPRGDAQGWEDYRVRRGDTFPRIAARVLRAWVRNGRLERPDAGRRRELIRRLAERIVEHAGPRFAAWPAVVDGEEDGGRHIQFGEYAYRRRGRVRSTAQLDETLVHEAAHVGDHGHCADTGYYYGPDDKHYDREILTPQAAFQEGWANYQSLRVSSEMAQHLSRDVLEATLYSEEHGVNLDPDAVQVRHQVGNEFWVARVLQQLEAATSAEAVEDAFRATFSEDCATLATLLEHFRTANSPIDLELVLQVALGGNDREGLRQLASGELPEGIEATRLAVTQADIDAAVIHLDEVMVFTEEDVYGSEETPPSAPAGPYGL